MSDPKARIKKPGIRSRLVGVSLVFLAAGPWSGPGILLAHTPGEKAFYLQSRIVLRLSPGDATAGNAVGIWHLEYNELEKSSQAFQRVANDHPGNFLAVAGLALIDEIEGDPASALARVEGIAQAPPAFDSFLDLIRGRLWFRLGRYEMAERELRAGFSRRGNAHDLNFWLGRIREATGRPDKAVSHYEKAIEADPFWPEPYSRLSVLYQSQGRPERARKVLEEVSYLRNPSPYPNNDIRVMWAWVMRRKEQ